jgi:hypothetical protein
MQRRFHPAPTETRLPEVIDSPLSPAFLSEQTVRQQRQSIASPFPVESIAPIRIAQIFVFRQDWLRLTSFICLSH